VEIISLSNSDSLPFEGLVYINVKSSLKQLLRGLVLSYLSKRWPALQDIGLIARHRHRLKLAFSGNRQLNKFSGQRAKMAAKFLKPKVSIQNTRAFGIAPAARSLKPTLKKN